MQRKKIAVIGCVGLPANYGGFETFAEYLVKHSGAAFEYTVYCSSQAYPDKPSEYEGVRLKYIPLKANGVQSIPYDIWSMLDALRYADTLLVLGVSGCLILPLLRLLGCRRRIIVNLDGQEWKRDKWGTFTRRFLKYSERVAVRHADAVVGDNKVISDYVTAEYGKPCELIEYGADQQFTVPLTPQAYEQYAFLAAPYAFAVGRIVPENNVAMVLEAFESEGDLPLVMVGNWKASEYGRELLARYGHHARYHLLDPIYDLTQLNLLRSNCRLYVHGHSCGGTNPSLVEAMYLGVPIAAFDVNFNRETTENRALYFSDTAALRQLIKEPVPAACGPAMKEIADRRYNWKRIAELYADLY